MTLNTYFRLNTKPQMNQLILVLGPARSGKSEWAEMLAAQLGNPVIYVATAQVDPADLEWQARIEHHQRRRPATWQTINAPTDLTGVIHQATVETCLLVDSLGTWLANVLEQDSLTWEQTLKNFLETLGQSAADVILVAEETGWGVVPAYPIGRLFRDRLGTLTRRVGAIANSVYLVTGGHVLNLSQLGHPLPDRKP